MNFSPTRRIIGADWEQRDFDVKAFADFLKSREISAVAAVKNRAAIDLDHKTTKSAMEISEKTRAPVMTRRKRNLQAVEEHAFPVIKFVHDVDSKVVNERVDADRRDDGAVGGSSSQGARVKRRARGV